MWKDAVHGLVDLLAPRCCAACDSELEPSEAGFCRGCEVGLEPAGPTWEPPARAAALFLYGGPLASAIRRFKYGERPDVARTLGALVAGAAPAYAGLVDVVVPVPLHPRRLRERGFDQATLIARPFARALSLRLDVRRVRRVRHTPKQAGLDSAARTSNVRGAFFARADALRPRVLLFDDVRTTGATLAACAEALRESGAAEIYALTLARRD